MKWHLAVQVVKNKNKKLYFYIMKAFDSTSHTVETITPSKSFEDVSSYGRTHPSACIYLTL